MKQLTLGVIMSLINDMSKAGVSAAEIRNMPVYIGNDDELNGIHTALYGQLIDTNSTDDADFIELINEDHHNIQLNGKAILIS